MLPRIYKFRCASLINPLTELVCFRQMVGFVDLRFAVSISAAASQKHPAVMEADVVHNGKLVVGHRLLKGPEEIIR